MENKNFSNLEKSGSSLEHQLWLKSEVTTVLLDTWPCDSWNPMLTLGIQ